MCGHPNMQKSEFLRNFIKEYKIFEKSIYPDYNHTETTRTNYMVYENNLKAERHEIKELNK
jgi:hypothetical protein